MSEVIQGLEAINYQTKSQLGEDLANLFQDILLYKKSLINDPESPDDRNAHANYILDGVHKYWKEYGTKRFRDIVKKHCNLRVGSFKAYGGSKASFTMNFAICIDISNGSFGPDLMYRQTGRGRLKHPEEDTNELAEDFRKIAEAFDKTTGKLGITNIDALRVDTYIPFVVIDTNAAFCLELFLGEDKVIEPFTPRELAAIYLHELGHALSMLEHCNDIFYVKDRLDNFAITVSKATDAQKIEAFKVINDDILPGFRKTIDNLPAEYQSKSLELSINLLSKVGDTTIRYLVEDHRGFFGKVGTCILLWMNFLCTVVSHAIMSLVRYETNRALSRLEFKANDTKISDTTRNARNASMAERWADQLVARHGFGIEHLAVLRKIHALSNFASTYGSLAGKVIMLLGGDIATIHMFSKMTEFFSFERRVDPAAYEGYIERMARVVEDTYSFFKYADDIPTEIVEQWYWKVKEMKKIIKSERNYMDSNVWKTFTGILKNMLSMGRRVDLIIDGNLYDDITRFVDQLDKLNNNQLFMFGSRLKNIN